MKYVVCVPDGCSDLPIQSLGGKTPLEVASMPTLARLAARGEVGRAAVIPPGMPPGSDVGNMSILGYDPARFHTGRAPIEAAALGLRLPPDRVAYRCNLSTVGDDGTMIDFAGGHPSTEQATEVIRALDAQLGSGVGADIEFHPGVQYRHILVAPADWADASCTPPHDLSDKPAVWPTGPAASKLQAVMDASREIVGPFGLQANQVWLWGQGVLMDIDRIEVPGATGWFDTDYEGKRDAALRTLEAGADLFLIHVEATDEAGHAGNLDEKIKALEAWDRRILADLVDGLDAMGPWRLLLLPDHPTPVELKTHTTDSVPYLLVDSAQDGPGGTYTEAATADGVAVPGHSLMARLVTQRP